MMLSNSSQHESRRNAQYDGLILDPPKFGRGPKGEVWEFYKLLPNLLAACRQVLGKQPVFVILTAYAVKASSITLYTGMQEMMSGVTAPSRQARSYCPTERRQAAFHRHLRPLVFTRVTLCAKKVLMDADLTQTNDILRG